MVERGKSMNVRPKGWGIGRFVYMLAALGLLVIAGCEGGKPNDGHSVVNFAKDPGSGGEEGTNEFSVTEHKQELGQPEGTMAMAGAAAQLEDSPAAEVSIYTDEEYAALIDSQFSKVHKLDSNGGKEYFYGLAVTGENEVVYSVDNGEGFELLQHDFRTGKTYPLISLKGNLITLSFSLERQTLEISYSEKEKFGFKSWLLSDGKLTEKSRTVLAENGQWTMFYSAKGDGIWAAARDGSGEFKLTDYWLDHSPLWIPGTNRFVYVAHTGRTIADGSGYEFALTMYDLDTRKGKELPFDKGPWKTLGWTEPGKKLLVDHAFNEGLDRSYTEPYIVDLELMKEYPLLSADMDAYDINFNTVRPSFVVTIPGYLAFYDGKGEIESLEPWFAYSPEQLASPFTYSPDGKRGAYLVSAAPNGDSASNGQRLVIADAYGREPVMLHDYHLPIIAFEWSPNGDSIAALIQSRQGSFIVIKELGKGRK